MKKLVCIFLLFILSSCAAASASEQPRVIKVGVLTTAPPFCFLTNKQGKVGLRGISPDILTQVQRLLDVEFQYISCSSLTERRDMLAQGKIDLIDLEIHNYRGQPPMAFIPTDVSTRQRIFVNTSCRTVVCVQDLEHKRVAAIAGFPLPPLKSLNEENLILLSSPLEALQLLNKGIVDVFLAPAERAALYIIDQENYENIMEVGVTIDQTPLSLAVRAEDVELYHSLNKAMETLRRHGVLTAIIRKWDGVTYERTLWQKNWKVLLAAAAVGLAGVLIFFVWNFQLKLQVRRITNDLRTSERRYRSLIESSPDMIFLVDEDGLIHHANDKAKRVCPGVIEKNGAWANISSLVASAEASEIQRYLASVFADSSESQTFHLLNSASDLVEVEMVAARILTEHGDGYLACCFARDVTERNRIERELIQADRLATIGELAAGVAHEINNPLGIVQANLELITSHGWFNAEAKEFLDSMQRNIIRAGKITRDLLAMARPKNPEMAMLDLVDLIDLTVSMLSHQLKGIEIDHQSPFTPSPVWGDQNLIQQVLVNIFLNAIAAMANSPVKKIRIRYCSPPGEDAVCVRIEDTGKGIPQNFLNDIFESFFTYDKQEGFGLGLFISRRIIERHNGMIFAESEMGKGTQIIIELPAIKTESLNNFR